jgi:type IX secretion system PorP/SprF family membrane protein
MIKRLTMNLQLEIKLGLMLLITSLSSALFGQQDPMYTQYMFNLSSVNAAAIGRGDNMSFMMVDRFQWVGFEGAPKSMSITADIPAKFFNSGVGFTYVNDRIGPEQSNNFYLDYAYHIQLVRGLRLGMGLKGGFKVYSAAFEGMGLDDEVDSEFSSDIYGEIMPNFGLGLFLYSDTYYFGLSSPKLVNHKYEGSDDISGGEERHYFAIAGYVLSITDDIVFKPSVALKMVTGSPLSLDITANFLFKNTLWAGLGYRSGDALTFLTQIQLSNRFRFGYAYDFTLSQMRTVSSGTHEIMLSYELKSFKDKVRSPRYF